MNYMEQDLHNKVLKFEEAMDDLAGKIRKPARKVRTIKRGFQSVNWTYVAMAVGLLTTILIFKKARSH